MSQRLSLRAVVFVLFVLVNAFTCWGQIQSPTYDQMPPVPGVGHDYIKLLNETVQPATGAVSIRIGVPMPPGRGITVPFAFGYDSSSAHSGVGYGGNFGWGWNYTIPTLYETTQNSVGPAPNNIVCHWFSNYLFTDMQGTTHALGLVTSPDDGKARGCSTPTAFLLAGDASVEAVTTACNDCITPPPVTITTNDGLVYYFPNNSAAPQLPTWIKDRNGNTVTFTGQNNGAVQVTDTLNRLVLNVSSFYGSTGDTVNVSGLGNSYQITWTNQPYKWSLNYQMIGDTHCVSPSQQPLSGSLPAISQIKLPNGQSYQFQYDPQSGMLSKLIYPSGAYVRYVWSNNSLANENVVQQIQHMNKYNCETLYDAPAVKTRYVSFDGVHEVQEQDFSYSTTWVLGYTGLYKIWSTKQTRVTTNDLVRGTTLQTVYNYVPLQVAKYPNYDDGVALATGVFPVNAAESTVLSHDGNGTLLKAVVKSYNDFWSPPNDEQTTLENGQTSEVKSCYRGTPSNLSSRWCPNATGNGILDNDVLTDQWVYDYGTPTGSASSPGTPGVLLRYIHADYNNFSTPLFSTAASILDRPSDVITYDGNNNKVAETDYTYDQGSVSQALAPNHDEINFGVGLPAAGNNRGNVTTKTVKCFIGSTTCPQGDSVTTYAFDETGQVVSTTDPIGKASGDATHHTTTYSYADNFADHDPIGSDAYLTEIDYPSTTNISGTVIKHSVKFSYAYVDGQLMSSTDENGNLTNYAYNDALRRLTSTINPDGGETDLTYNDSSANITTTTKINANAGLTILSQMDGMGHMIQTQLTSDPQGTVYTNTAYDGMGRAYAVSNPYRTSNDPTGTKISYYDALGRITGTMNQDGSVTAISYDGNQTTSVDEAGNPRRKISDALGRLIEVDEATTTDPSTPAAQASGSLTVTGSLLFKNTYASGTITINGAEQCGTYYAGAQGVPTQICDIGTISATINGITASQSYCCQANAAGLASGLASAIMSATNGSVSAIANGNVITITAISGGPCCNYSLSATSATNYPPGSGAPVTFSPPSFTTTTSGPSLTGGATTYDSGTAVFTVGSTTVSASYGANSTATSVASALAQALSGSPFTGAPNGPSLTITANAAGPAGNVNASLTSNSNLFGNGGGSFSGSAALNGGTNSHVSFTQSYVTLYQYDALGNLICAVQKATDSTAFTGCGSAPASWRPRAFAYDSMSHLLTAQNPESGKITYTYDPNGNITSKTDAKGLTINYNPSDSPIDALNRITKKEYSNGAKPVSYVWDATSLFGAPMHNQIGRLSYQSAGNGGTERFDYDVMGRLIQVYEYENLDNNSPWINATYDLAGNMTWVQYPDSRQVSYTYDSANRLSNVASTGWNGTLPPLGVYNYWIANSYFPNGTPQQVTYGNGVTETMALNNRLQPAEQKVNSSMQAFVDRVYGYCHSDGDCFENNGNVQSITDKLNPILTQTFTYDWLNRVTGATEGRWGQSFQYDPWGNLTAKNTTKGSMNSVGLQVGDNNQVTNISYNNLAGIAYSYDANGNLVADDMRGYTYDEENRVTALGISPGVFTGAASYSYDPDGNRVTKVTGGTTTEYVYFKGQPMAELNPATGEWVDYVFAGGKRIAKSDTSDNQIHIHGVRCSNCGGNVTYFWSKNPSLLPYTVKAGDKLYFRQFQAPGASGGVLMWYGNSNTRGMQDSDGQSLTDDSITGAEHQRKVDLSPIQGQTINYFCLTADLNTAPGAWDIYFQDIVVVSADGTVHPLYVGNSSDGFYGTSTTGGDTNISHGVFTYTGAGAYPSVNTYFFHGDQIGSSRVLTSSGGWPVWQGTFLPFGEEYNPQPTLDHYKFSGKERDAESNNDYFGARYYDNNIGRWMTPDWAAKATTVPYARFGDPQTLNLYGFMANDPLNAVDADGHQQEECSQHDGGGSPSKLCATKNIVPVVHDSKPQTESVRVGNNVVTTTTIYHTATTTERDKNGKVTSVTVDVTKDTKTTATGPDGKTRTLGEQEGIPVLSATLTGDNLKDTPQTIAAKLANRKIGEDVGDIPHVGPIVKKVADFFDITYGDVVDAAAAAAPYYCPSPTGCGVPFPNK